MLVHDAVNVVAGSIIDITRIFFPFPTWHCSRKRRVKALLPAQMVPGVPIFQKITAMTHPVDGLGGQGVCISNTLNLSFVPDSLQ